MPAVKLGRFSCGLICGLAVSNVTQQSAREMLGPARHAIKKVSGMNKRPMSSGIAGQPVTAADDVPGQAHSNRSGNWCQIDGPFLAEANIWLNESTMSCLDQY